MVFRNNIMTDRELYRRAERLGGLLKSQEAMLATAESCTGGWIAQAITSVPGSSAWFERGFVTYSNASKTQMLGVHNQTLAEHGAVSAATAREMAAGALANSEAHIAVAVTGIAGPDGGTEAKPVGTVFIAWQAGDQSCHVERCCFQGGRQQVRMQTVERALQRLCEFLGEGYKYTLLT